MIKLFQIQVCKNALSQEDVTPKNATKILLLAERHSLNELKKVNQDDKNIHIYESIATVGESRVWWKADFQSGSRVLNKVF